MPGTLWIDVEDLFEYAAHHTRLTGIQRLSFEVCQALWEEHGDTGRVRFARHAGQSGSGRFRTVRWSALAALLDQFASEKTPASPSPVIASPFVPAVPDTAAPGEARARTLLRRLARRLPNGVRHRLAHAARLQLAATVALLDLLCWIPRGLYWRARVRLLGRPRPEPSARRIVMAAEPMPPAAPSEPAQETAAEPFAAAVRPGDVLLTLGASWSCPEYATLIRAAKHRYGVRFAFLVHDIIPMRYPEWFDRGLIRVFRAWVTAVMPLADQILAVSRATAHDVERLAAEQAVVLPRPIRVIPVGTGFNTLTGIEAAASGRLPPSGTYALCVSTIEARKNHLLLFRVWRRLLAEMPAEAVPTLVFAGKVGWLVDDLMRQLGNCDYLDGKIQVLESVTDAELGCLYRGCLFTVFPSLYEGWGLPVSESLAFGKPCLASNATSIPEAGGDLARYFDPTSLPDAHAVIRATIEDREGLSAWEAEITRRFTPVPWRATAQAVLEALDDPVTAK